VPPAFIAAQIGAVLGDIGADALKTGMLGDSAAIEAVAAALSGSSLPLVADPVMVAKGGTRLLDARALPSFLRLIVPLASVLTPNIPEAEVLTGIRIDGLDTMCRAAEALLRLGAPAVLLKGGHLPGPLVADLLATSEGIESFIADRIETNHTHGTGCTLASAVATGLAQGLDLYASVLRARAYVRAALVAAPGFGSGHGPLWHGVTIDTTCFRTGG
jgi:hydroxymethylpyrimidine/phosphomethylpyrimidine kinase